MKNFFKYLRKVCAGESVSVFRSPKTWDDDFRKGKWDFLLNSQPNTSLILNIINSYSDRDDLILDIGCGNGALTLELSKYREQSKLFGIDISSEAISRLQTKLPYVNLRSASISDWNFWENTKLDVIVMSEVLYYVDYKFLLDKLKSFIKPETIIIISVYNSWRSLFIWYYVRKKINQDLIFSVYNFRTKWNIVVGKYKIK